jgi:uncharacterized membrane protein
MAHKLTIYNENKLTFGTNRDNTISMRLLVSNLCTLTYLIGIANATIKVLPIALFLSVGTSSNLALLFLIASCTVPLIGIMVETMRKALSAHIFSWIQRLINTALLLSIFPLYLGYSLEISSGYFVILQTALTTQNLLNLDITLGTFLSIDEAKKYYRYLSIGRSIGKLSGNLLLPSIILYFGNLNTILFVVFIHLGIAFMNIILEITNQQRLFSQSQQAKKSQKTTQSNLLSNSFIIYTLALVVWFTLTYRLMDLTGYQYTKLLFKSEVEMTAFMCYIFLTVSVIEIFSNLFMFRPLLNRFGVQATQCFPLFTVPLLITVFSLAYLVFPSNELIVALVFSGWILFNVGNSSYFMPIFNISYNSLPPQQRTLSNRLKAYIALPLGSVLGNGIFAGIMLYFGPSLPVIYGSVFVFCALGVYLSYLSRDGYIKNLRHQLLNEIPLETDFVLTNHAEKIILERVDPLEIKETLYLIEQSKNGSQVFLENFLLRCFESPHTIVLKEALKISPNKPKPLLLEKVRALTAHPEFIIQLEALEALHRANETLYNDQELLAAPSKDLITLFDSIDIKRSPQVNENGWFELKQIAIQNPRDTIRILKRLEPSNKKNSLLKQIIEHGDFKTKEKALFALPQDGNFPDLLSLLKTPSSSQIVIEKLIFEKEQSLPFLTYCVQQEGLNSQIYLKLFPAIVLQPLESISQWILEGLQAPIDSPLFNISLQYFSQTPLLNTEQPLTSSQIENIKDKYLEIASLLHQLTPLFSDSTGAQHSISFELKQVESRLLSLIAMQYKDSLILDLSLWAQSLDPFKKGFVKEWIYYTFTPSDQQKIKGVKQITLSKKEVIEKVMTHSMISDILKATVALKLKPTSSFGLSREHYPLTLEALQNNYSQIG